tara:strand:- start:12157 stop:12687 length:531 start_codon:yes stop_codon:yes gene_type:complete
MGSAVKLPCYLTNRSQGGWEGVDLCQSATYLWGKNNEGTTVATEAFEELVEDFEFLDDWEDRYRHVIDLGKAMDPLEEALRVPATKVDGCASQVWLHASFENGVLHFDGASDAMIVSGLIAVLRSLYNGLSPADVLGVDARAEMGRLGLNEHLSAQRSNGLTAMIERVRETAAAQA